MLMKHTILLIGCDFHAGFEMVSIFDNRNEQVSEKKLLHPQEDDSF